MKSSIITRFANQAYSFIYLQLCITLATLPLLVCWGIPISLLSIVGNAIFSPFLTVFLFLCTVIFFTNLIAIPNQWVIYITEYVVQFWLYCMSLTSKSMLLHVPCPNIVIIILSSIVCGILLHQKVISSPLKKCILVFSTLVCILITIYFTVAKQPVISTIECNKGIVTIISTRNKLCIIDPGVIGKNVNAPDWIEYTLLPHLTKLYATSTITDFIALQPSYSTFSALERAVRLMTIHTIHIPYWKGTASKGMLRKWFNLKETAHANSCAIKRLTSYSKIKQYEPCNIKVNQLPSCIEPKPDFTYPAFEITLDHEQETAHILSNKYKKTSDT